MNLIFIDTETTGLTSSDRLIQCAYAIHEEGAHLKFSSEYFTPPCPLGIDAMCVNHITEKILKGKPAFIGSEMAKELQTLLDSGYVLVAHNAAFDIGMLEREGITVPQHICTKKVAKYLDLAPKHNLQYLRYSLDLDTEGLAHSADGDVRVLIALYLHMLKQVAPEQMLHITRTT